MSEWREVTLEEIAFPARYSVVGGPFGSALGRKDYVREGVPVIRGVQLSGPGLFSHGDFVYVSEEKADRHSGNLAFPGDVLVTQRGTVGQVGLIPMDAPFRRYMLSQSQMKLTVDPARASAKFVYYWLRSPQAQQSMVGSTISAGVPHINLGTFKNLTLRLPPLAEQACIAEVLGSIDDLIENNRRRTAVLEEMAQAIYREWFVCFRYPGHEDVRLVDSSLHPIPAGWAEVELGEVADARRGLSWDRSAESSDGSGVRVVTIPNLGARLNLERCTTLIGVSPSDILRFAIRSGDILLIGSNGNPNRVGHAVRVPSHAYAVFASFIMRVRPDPAAVEPLLLFHQLQDPNGVIEAIRATAVGATGLRNLRITVLRETTVLVPPRRLSARFGEVAEPLVTEADALARQGCALAALRDLLLPRLVTGTIDVSHLDLDALTDAAIA